MNKNFFRAYDYFNDEIFYSEPGKLSAFFESVEQRIAGENKVTVMQFTGRFYGDKKLFEGDLIEELTDAQYGNILEVFWDEKLDGFACRSLDSEHLYQTPIPESGWRIIGDIYTNPEIIKKQKRRMEKAILC